LENHPPGNKNIAIVYHPMAGKGKAVAVVEHLVEKLRGLGISFVVFRDESPEDFEAFSSVWLVGGDGTLNYFINKYPSISVPIALFKGGTGNDFAWKLYGERTVDEYFDVALNGAPKKVDAGICNGRYFINGVGIGFDGDVVQSMGTEKILSGHLAYLLVVLKKILLYREKKVHVESEKMIWKGKLFMLTVANGSRYGGGFLVAPHAIINDGKLDVVLIKRISPMLRFFYLPAVEKGRHLSLRFVEIQTSKKITVTAQENLSAHLDGEFMKSPQFIIEIKEKWFSFLY